MAAADAGSEQPERPKLVALSGPAAEPALAPDDAQPAPAPDDAESTSADAVRLALERSLSGPPAPAPRIAGVGSYVSASETDLPVYTPATSSAPWAPQPHDGLDHVGERGRGIPDAIITATPQLVQALRAELAMRAHAEAGLRARAVDAETRLAARVLLSQRTAEALSEVRAELDQLARLLTDERARRQAAEQRVAELEQQLAVGRDRSDDAAVEIASLRDSLLALRPFAEDREPSDGSPNDASPSAIPEVRADRLSDALDRLRASTDPIDPAPEGQGSPAAPATTGVPSAALAPTSAGIAAAASRATLAGPFRKLCRRDPALASQLVLSLLPLQWTAYPQPVSYDIVLGPHRCVQVTSGDGAAEIARQPVARPRGQVDFQLVGGPERFAKLLAAGRIRRRFGFWVLSRVRGNRDGLAALDALLALPLDLPALTEAELSTDTLILAQLQAWIKRAQSE